MTSRGSCLVKVRSCHDSAGLRGGGGGSADPYPPSLPDVESLQILRGSIAVPPTPRYTPRPVSNLRQLTVSDCIFFTGSGLSLANVPHIDTLSLRLDTNRSRADEEDTIVAIRELVDGIAPQLKALSLADKVLAEVLDLFPLLTSLVVFSSRDNLFSITGETDIFHLVNTLPHTLPVLHIPGCHPGPPGTGSRGRTCRTSRFSR